MTFAPRCAVRFVAALCAALALAGGASCGPSTSCTAAICPKGCCASDGTCQPGSANNACGKSGAACGVCAVGQSCVAGACSAGLDAGSGGGGGGGSGGGGGTGGGGGGGTGGGGGGGQSAIGGTCTTNGDCVSNTCITSTPGGYCSQTCSSTAPCPTGSSCSGTFSAGGPACMQNCSAPGTGRSDCRAGHVCEKNFISGSPQGTCFPACTSQNDCAGVASGVCDLGYCCGASKYKCCSTGTACLGGATCGTDGYCP